MNSVLFVEKNPIGYGDGILLLEEIENQVVTNASFWFKTNGPFL